MNLAIRLILASVLASGTCSYAQVSASPERFSPQTQGYIERARIMQGEGNYAGVIDQLRHLGTQQAELSEAQAEEFTWLLADAYYQRGDSECLRLLIDFAKTFPASPLAPDARFAIGDYFFFKHDWPDALEAYNEVDKDRLNRDRQVLFSYRKALALIKTGHFAEALPLVNDLREAAGYEDAYSFYRAYLYYIDGKFNDAYNLFGKVPAGIEGLDAGYYMTQIEYSRGEYEDVIRNGSALLRKSPVPELAPEMRRIVGLSYFKTGNIEAAKQYLTAYVADNDGEPSADALYALGAADYADGDYAGALERFSQLTDLNNDIGQGAWLYLGQCYLRQDNPSSAAIAFEKATRMSYDRKVSETALYNYVTALTKGGKVPFASAADLLERFVNDYPDSEFTPEVEAYLATAYYNDRNYTKALQYIEAIRNPSQQVTATRQKILYELGVEKMSNGQADEAVRYLAQAVSLRKYDTDLSAQASLWLGDAYFSLNRYADACKAYEAFVRDDKSRTNHALGLYDLAYAEYKLKDYSAAASHFATALSATPALERNLANDARIRRADCLYYEGQYAEASKLYSQAIEDGATDTDYALFRRAALYGLAGDNKSKLSDLAVIETNYPDSRWLSDALLETAHTYEETGRNDLAADAYKKRLNVTNDVDLDELLRMAKAMHEAGRSADLLEVTERIRRAGGLEADELAEISLYEADALTDLGREDEATEIYTTLARNTSSLPGSQAAVALAELALKNGDYASARDLMEEFTDTGSPHQYWLARGFIALADAYYGLGNKSLAREYILSLEENYPGSEKDIKSNISSRLKKWQE